MITVADDVFDPLYKIEIPHKELDELISSPPSNAEQQLIEFSSLIERITHWLETAHMTAFTIEQSVKRGDLESYTVQPLEQACSKMQPLIALLAEYVDEQEQALASCKWRVTKIQSEWSGLQHFIHFIKTLIEGANEKQELRASMETILLQIDDLSMMIFKFQEKRHKYPENDEKKEDTILLDIDNRVGPLFTSVEKVYTRMTSPHPPEDTTGLLTRKHLLVQERWECLRVEIDELKLELKEGRWLVVFRQVADQVDDMMNGLEKTVQQCYNMIQQIKEGHGMTASSSSTTSSASSSTTSASTTSASTKLRSVEKNFEAKYKYYTPSITKMLMMLGNGIAARVSRNVATLQRHESMLERWNTLKTTMDHLRKRDLPDIVEQQDSSSHGGGSHCPSRLSDRSDSTTGSNNNNWRDLISPSTARFIHNKSSSPSLLEEDGRSKSPFSHKFSPSPLFMEHYRGSSPIGRTTSPSYLTRESFNSVGSALRPNSISPSNSILKSSEEEEDDMISTKDFRPAIRSKSSLSQQRSITPNPRRSGTPSMIPRPKTPTIANTVRPRSSMARITNRPIVSSSQYKPDPKDPLDKQVALIVNRSPIPIQCSKKQGSGDGRYYFGNELTPSLGGGKKIYTCKLMTYENSGRNKVLIRVGGGWQDLEIFLLEHMNLIG